MRKRASKTASGGAKKAKRTSSAGKKSSKKKTKPADKKVKKTVARKATRAAPKKVAKKKVKRATPKKPAARKVSARKKTAARKAAARKVSVTRKAKKLVRPMARKTTRAAKVGKTTRKATGVRTTRRAKSPARKPKAAKKVTRATARKSATRAKAARKLSAAAAAKKKKALQAAKKAAARKQLLEARKRRKLALAERKAAAKERAREAARRKAEKKAALKAKKEAAAAKKLARKLAAKEAKARAMEAVRARRAKLAEAKARKKAAEAEARAAAKQKAKEAAAAAKAAAKAEKAAQLARAASDEPPLRVGTSRGKLHGEDRKGKAAASAPPGALKAGKKGESPTSPPGRGSTPPGGVARARVPVMRPVLPTIPIEPPKPTLEERAAQVTQRLEAQSPEVRKEYDDRLYMSWIHHDSALEGVVYSFHELQIAVDPSITVVPDSSMQPVCDEIRRHKEALDFVHDAAVKKRQPVTTDIIKRIYLILHPEEGDLKTVKYRKDIPQHRLYFHEYAPPDKIAYLVRQVVEWINDPETRRTRTTLRIAARAHYDLLRAFPFPNDSGKVARLFMNFLLLRAGYPPAIIHSTERQRYYEALKGSPLAIVHMVQEALENSIASIEKFLDERTTRVRSFVS